MRTTSQFAAGIVAWFTDNFNHKFFAGDKEHGGNIWRKPCTGHLREELIDAITYLSVLEDQQQKMKVLLGAALVNQTTSDWSLVKEANNFLIYGNAEGVEEEELTGNSNDGLGYSEIKYG